uniref:translation initiation factor eIF2B subunit gamma isoform X2 n=1 Tax=Myxine glutinosa TaxID=7769 RepID=UPI00358FEE19
MHQYQYHQSTQKHHKAPQKHHLCSFLFRASGPTKGGPPVWHRCRLTEVRKQDSLATIAGLQQRCPAPEPGVHQVVLGRRTAVHKVTNVLVVSCDLVTDACLQPLVDLFRLRNAALVALVRQVDEPTEPIPGQKGKRPHEQRDFVGLDESGTRLLSLASEADLDDDLSLKKSLLCRFSRIHIKTNLMDAHLYCLKKWVLDLLAEEKSISSVKGELVPFLVKKQFSAPLGQKDLHAFIPADGLAGLAQERSAWDETEAAGRHGGAIRCYVHQLRGGLCLRANTLASYVEANKQVARVLPSLMVAEECLIHPSASISEKSQVGADSMVGRETQVEERTSVKRSVVGDYCVVRLRSKITSSIVMHRVTIGEGCNIQGSVLCEGAVLGAGVELKDCLVGSRIEVEPRVKRTNEIIERMIMI